MSDAPFVLPVPSSASHVNVFASATEFLDKIMDTEIRTYAPTVLADGVPVNWVPSVVVSEIAHPLTQEVTMQPGLMLTIWLGPNAEGQVVGATPVMDQVYAMADRAEIAQFLRFSLQAIEQSYTTSGAKF